MNRVTKLRPIQGGAMHGVVKGGRESRLLWPSPKPIEVVKLVDVGDKHWPDGACSDCGFHVCYCGRVNVFDAAQVVGDIVSSKSSNALASLAEGHFKEAHRMGLERRVDNLPVASWSDLQVGAVVVHKKDGSQHKIVKSRGQDRVGFVCGAWSTRELVEAFGFYLLVRPAKPKAAVLSDMGQRQQAGKSEKAEIAMIGGRRDGKTHAQKIAEEELFPPIGEPVRDPFAFCRKHINALVEMWPTFNDQVYQIVVDEMDVCNSGVKNLADKMREMLLIMLPGSDVSIDVHCAMRRKTLMIYKPSSYYGGEK